MASRMRHRTEPLFGWLFLLVVIAMLAAIFHVATQPVDGSGNRSHHAKVPKR
jgi:hypothetical protein